MDEQDLMRRYEQQFDLLIQKHQVAKQKLSASGWKSASAEFEEVEETARLFTGIAAEVSEKCSAINQRDFPNHWTETIKVPEER